VLLRLKDVKDKYLRGLWVEGTDQGASISRVGLRPLGKEPVRLLSSYSEIDTRVFHVVYLPFAVAVLSRPCCRQRVTGYIGPAHAKCIDELPSQGKV